MLSTLSLSEYLFSRGKRLFAHGLRRAACAECGHGKRHVMREKSDLNAKSQRECDGYTDEIGTISRPCLQGPRS